MTTQIPGASIPGAIPGTVSSPATVAPLAPVPGSDFAGGGAGLDPLSALDDATPAEAGGGGLPDGDYALAVQAMEVTGATEENPEATPRIKVEFVVVGAENASLMGRKHFNSFFLSTKAAPYTRTAMIHLGFGGGSGADVRQAIQGGTFRGHAAVCTVKKKAGQQYANTYVNQPIGKYPTDPNGMVLQGSTPVPFG